MAMTDYPVGPMVVIGSGSSWYAAFPTLDGAFTVIAGPFSNQALATRYLSPSF